MSLDYPASGGDEAVDLGAINVPAGTGELTITAWGNPDAVGLGQEQVIIAKSDSTGTSSSFKMQVEDDPDDNLRGIINSNVDNGASAIVAGAWTFFAMVYDSVDKTLYVNAVQDATEADAGGDIDISADPFKLGCVDNGSNVREFDGLLEDIRVYTRALSPAELQTMFVLLGKDNIVFGLHWRWMQRELPPGTAATIAGSIIDFAGRNNGTPENSPVYQAGILR